MQLTHYSFIEWIGKQKESKALYRGINSKRKWLVLFTINFDKSDASPVTAEKFMQKQ